MKPTDIPGLLTKQNVFFNSRATLPVNYRIDKLKQLKKAIQKNEKEILDALYADLGKSEFEAFSGEVGLSVREISFHIRNLKRWSKPKRVSTPLFLFPSKSYICKQPYGKVLIMVPFNYPLMLAIIPLVGAISAGNVAIIKPSELTAKTTVVINKIISETFEPEHVAVMQGGVEVGRELLAQRWDMIFFTGSLPVGKMVMEAAAKNLTPVVLELGGKNPVVVDKDAHLETAAKRIIWGKMFNAGQSCVAPDYLLVHEEIREEFIKLLKKAIVQMYTENPKESKDFARIINEKAIDRLIKITENETIYTGGESDRKENYFAPTIITDVNPDSPLMQEEIFGPVLPVISFNELDDAIHHINSAEKPLVAYFFSENKKKQRKFLDSTSSGDACINEVVVHFTNFSLPFGGIGYSGMGKYQGKYSFEAFSHRRSVMKTTTRFDIPFRYPPIKKYVLKAIRQVFQ